VPEMDTSVEQLTHGYNSHEVPPKVENHQVTQPELRPWLARNNARQYPVAYKSRAGRGAQNVNTLVARWAFADLAQLSGSLDAAAALSPVSWRWLSVATTSKLHPSPGQRLRRQR